MRVHCRVLYKPSIAVVCSLSSFSDVTMDIKMHPHYEVIIHHCDMTIDIVMHTAISTQFIIVASHWTFWVTHLWGHNLWLWHHIGHYNSQYHVVIIHDCDIITVYFMMCRQYEVKLWHPLGISKGTFMWL